MAASYGIQPADGEKFWADDFNAPTLGTVWANNVTWAAGTGVNPTIADRKAKATSALTPAVGVGRNELTDLDTTEDYEFGVFVVPEGGVNRGTYHLFGRMESLYDLTTDGGFVVTVNLSSITPAAVAHYNSSGTLIASQTGTTLASILPVASGWLTVRVNTPAADTQIEVWFQDTLILDLTMTGTTTDAQKRIGFGMLGNSATFSAQIDSFEVVYKSTADTNKKPRFPLVVSQGGLLYRQTFHREVVAAGVGSVTLIDDRPVQAQDRLGILYLADHGDIILTGTDGNRETTNASLDAASVSDWTAEGIDPNNHVVVISDATGDIVDGLYEINDPVNDATELLLTTDFATGASGTCSYEIQRGPKKYEFNPDTSTDALTAWIATAGKGTVPVGNRAIALYRDRLVLAVDGTGAIYFSKAGDPNDWDFGGNFEDPARAFALGTGTLAGLLPQPVTAIFAYNDDCMVIGTASQLFILRSDPAFGGALNNVSQDVGILDVAAGTFTPEGQFIFLSFDGLYIMPGGCGASPFELSRTVLPEELRDLNKDLVFVSLAYDQKARGVHIFLTYDSDSHSATGDHWWFDWEGKGFWRVELDDDQAPTAVVQYLGSHSHDSDVIIGTRTGKIERFHKFHYKDKSGSDTAIDAFCDYGPIDLGNSERKGAVRSLTSVLAADSGDVTWRLFVGNDAESVSNQTGTGFTTGGWSAGTNNRSDPRAGGGAAMLRVEENSEIPWAVEGITATILDLGGQKL